MVDYNKSYSYYQQPYCLSNYYLYCGETAYQQPYLNPYVS